MYSQWGSELTAVSFTAMNPFTQRVASLLPNQYHKHALEVDSHLRVLGAPLGTVYAIGDCATIETRLVDHLLEMVDQCDENHDGQIDHAEFEKMMKVGLASRCRGALLELTHPRPQMVYRKFPTAQVHVEKIRYVLSTDRCARQHADSRRCTFSAPSSTSTPEQTMSWA